MPYIDQTVADFLDAHTYSRQDPVRFVVAARDFIDELEDPVDQRRFMERLIAEVGSRGEQPVPEQVLFLLNRELRWLDDPS
jgi:hypothetical protein